MDNMQRRVIVLFVDQRSNTQKSVLIPHAVDPLEVDVFSLTSSQSFGQGRIVNSTIVAPHSVVLVIGTRIVVVSHDSPLPAKIPNLAENQFVRPF